MTGAAEAERQLRVAERLYSATPAAAAKPWADLNLERRRPWIDRSCKEGHRDETE